LPATTPLNIADLIDTPMPEVQYTTAIDLPREAIWAFVKDMNNWAPLLTGYQSHEIIDEQDSIWTLKGDVGVLARVVRLKAHITEWNGPSKVAFTLSGINEAVEGDGVLEMTEHDASHDDTDVPSESAADRGLLGRLLDRVVGWLFRLFNRDAAAPRRALPAASKSRATSMLTFTLRMGAGGPTAPLVNAMLGPAMKPAAEGLANSIAAQLEQLHGLTPPAEAA